MELGLENKAGIVVGASRGIGKAIALELCREGDDLVIVARHADALAESAEQIARETGREVIPMAADVTDRAQVEATVDAAAKALGGLHILVNSGSLPGGSPTSVGRIDSIVDEDFLEDFNVKYMGTLRCTRAAIPHLRRSGWVAERLEEQRREPVRYMHNDYTELSGPRRVHDLLPPEEAERWAAHRFAIINVWRSIGPPVETTPLAFTDAQSLDERDLVATDLVYPDRVGEIYHLAFNPKQRWHYISRMTRDEAVLLKVFDSATDGRASLTAHGAFVNPLASPDAAPRESIELRALVSFGVGPR